MEFAERSRDRLSEAEVAGDLGSLFKTQHNPEIDYRLLLLAESNFRANGLSAEAESCRIEVAECLFHLGREARAIAAAEAALQNSCLGTGYRIKGLIQIALSQGRLGRFDAALRLLQQDALPLAQGSEQPLFIAQVKYAIGIIFMRILIGCRFPEISTEPPGLVIADRQCSIELVLSQFDQADAMLTAEEQLCSTACARQVIRGLFGDTYAVSILFGISDKIAAYNPLVAAWARCGAATVLVSQNRLEHASAVFDKVLMLAKSLGAVSLIRDATLQQSRIYEKRGAATAALVSYRSYSELLVESFAPPDPKPSPQEIFGRVAEVARYEPCEERVFEPVQVKRASEFISESLSEIFDIADVVRHCGVSRRNLEIVFRRSRGVTLAQYIRMRRMDRAVEMLQSTNWSIRAVALAVGYRSPALFAKAFRGQFGVNPAEWRRTGLALNPATS